MRKFWPFFDFLHFFNFLTFFFNFWHVWHFLMMGFDIEATLATPDLGIFLTYSQNYLPHPVYYIIKVNNVFLPQSSGTNKFPNRHYLWEKKPNFIRDRNSHSRVLSISANSQIRVYTHGKCKPLPTNFQMRKFSANSQSDSIIYILSPLHCSSVDRLPQSWDEIPLDFPWPLDNGVCVLRFRTENLWNSISEFNGCLNLSSPGYFPTLKSNKIHIYLLSPIWYLNLTCLSHTYSTNTR